MYTRLGCVSCVSIMENIQGGQIVLRYIIFPCKVFAVSSSTSALRWFMLLLSHVSAERCTSLKLILCFLHYLFVYLVIQHIANLLCEKPDSLETPVLAISKITPKTCISPCLAALKIHNINWNDNGICIKKLYVKKAIFIVYCARATRNLLRIV